MQAKDLLTWASALSWLRLAIAAGLHWLEPTPWLLPAYLFAVATDVADGWVASAATVPSQRLWGIGSPDRR